jgi:anti-sigma-K factor RskA
MTDQAKQLAHEQVADELPLYAVGALAGAQCANIRRHLEQCASCRNELARFRGDAALLALSVSGAAAPRRSRRRLLDSIGSVAHLPPAAPTPLPVRRPRWGLAPAFASLVLAVFAILLWFENVELRHYIHELEAQSAELQQSSAHAREVLALLSAPDAKHVPLAGMKAMPKGQVATGAHIMGATIYQKRTGKLLLMAHNLGPAPSGKAYELWLMPMRGAPMPAGMFKPDAHGNAMYMPPKPIVPAGTEAKAFAVSIEPEAGVPQPTSDIIMMGSGQ